MASTEQQIDDAVAKRHSQHTDTALGVQSSDLDMNLHKIIGLEDPTGDKDAAHKKYVDDHGGGGGGYTHLSQFVDEATWKLFYSNADGDVTELVLGTVGQYLKSGGLAVIPTWDVPAGGGDVVGPVSANDNAIPLFDTITGKLIKDSTRLIEDTMTDDKHLPDGHAIKEYGDIHWGGAAANPGGLDKHIQFNDSGVFGGDVDFTWTKGINQLDLANAQIRSFDSADSDFTLDTAPMSGGWAGWTYRGANSIKVRQSQVLPTDGVDHYFIDGFHINHLDLDLTDYETSVTDHEMHGLSVDMTGSCELNQYKGQIGVSIRTKGRTGWAGRGVAALTSETFQYGVGIASNEFHVYDPSPAESGIEQSTSMAGLQIVTFPHFGNEDGSHIYRGLKVDNSGLRSTYGIQLHSLNDTYGDGHMKVGIGMGDAKVTASAIIMPQSVSGHAGTDIVYDSVGSLYDITFYDRATNRFGFSVDNVVIAYIGPTGIDACTHKVVNVVDPVDPQDVATKAYGDLHWTTGSGDVVGPAGANDSTIVLFDNVTGKLVKDSTRLIEDAMTDDKHIPDGHAIKEYGDANWGGGGGSPGGSNTHIQFNDSGSFGGDSSFRWIKATNILNFVDAEIQSLDSTSANFTLDSSPLIGAWTGWTYRGANVIKVKQAQGLPTNGSSHYFIDGLQVNHYDGDTTNYQTSNTQHEMHGVNIDMTGVVSSPQYKDMIGLSVRVLGRINWTARGVSAITCETKQFGTGIASNEFHVFNPAVAEGGYGQSVSMAGLQIVTKPHMGNEDGSHLYRGLMIDNFGKRITNGIWISSGSDGYGSGHMKYALTMSSAIVTAAAIVMPQSSSGHVGTIIEYDANDYTLYDRGANRYNFTVGGNIKLSIDSSGIFTTSGSVEMHTFGYAFKGKDSGGNMLNLAYAGTVGYCMIGAYCNYTNIGSGSSQPNPVVIRVNGVNGKQIFVGATDSGGSGYRMLRVTN
jgi:hypothetical protein